MSKHGRNQSRTSMSLLGHVRSFSQNLSRRRSHVHTSSRDLSSFTSTCREFPSQLPSTNQQTEIQSDVSSQNALGLANSAVDDHVEQLETPTIPCDKWSWTQRRSWLPLSRPSFVTRSGSKMTIRTRKLVDSPGLISDPILTKTTNAVVAREQGVVCDENLDLTSGLPTLQQVESRTDGSIPQHEPFRFASMLRSLKTKGKQKAVVQIHPNPDDNSGHRHLAAIEKGIARCKTEAINLYQEKITKITGSGQVRPKNYSGAGPQSSCESTQPPLLQAVYHTRTGSANSGDGSLTRSFTTAINQLDFPPVQRLPTRLVKSNTSLFGLNKRSAVASTGHHINEGKRLPKSERVRHLLASPDRRRDQSDGTAKPPDDQRNGQSTNCESYLAQLATQTFDVRHQVFVPTLPAPGHPQGVNPLLMHTNAGGFAFSPANKAAVSSSQVQCEYDISDEDEVLEDAPIYSPSSGNLSQYNRNTPISAISTCHAAVEHETPTRVPSRQRQSLMERVGLRKSKSGMLIMKKGTSQTNLENEVGCTRVRRTRSMIGLLLRPEHSSEQLAEPSCRPPVTLPPPTTLTF